MRNQDVKQAHFVSVNNMGWIDFVPRCRYDNFSISPAPLLCMRNSGDFLFEMTMHRAEPHIGIFPLSPRNPKRPVQRENHIEDILGMVKVTKFSYPEIPDNWQIRQISDDHYENILTMVEK